MTLKAAILGASGYTGAELVRLLATHPQIEIAALSADRKAGQSYDAVFPHLRHLSLPPLVRWEYGFTPEPGSDEARLADYLRPRDWLGEVTSAP